MNIKQLAIEAGVIYVDGTSTYWTDNNAIEVLEKFAQAVIKEQLISEIIKLNLDLASQSSEACDEFIHDLLRYGFKGLEKMTMEELKSELEALK
jgi:acetyl-CoA carboxylase alpha subunit